VSELALALAEAIEILQAETRLGVEELFGERRLEPEQMTPRAAHAAGIIEGAGIALGLTALELLDELPAASAPIART
jgi:hypothetical protein